VIIYQVLTQDPRTYKVRRYSLPSRPEPQSLFDLEEALREICLYWHFELGKKEDFHIRMYRRRPASHGSSWIIVGAALVTLSVTTFDITIKKLVLSFEFRSIKDEFDFMNTGTVKHGEPSLYPKWQSDKIDLLRAQYTSVGESIWSSDQGYGKIESTERTTYDRRLHLTYEKGEELTYGVR